MINFWVIYFYSHCCQASVSIFISRWMTNHFKMDDKHFRLEVIKCKMARPITSSPLKFTVSQIHKYFADCTILFSMINLSKQSVVVFVIVNATEVTFLTNIHIFVHPCCNFDCLLSFLSSSILWCCRMGVWFIQRKCWWGHENITEETYIKDCKLWKSHGEKAYQF